MADKKYKYSQNIPGKFYVDEQCIACVHCVVEAPGFFVMNEEDGHAYVSHQPKNQKEIDLCISALETCPVEAIGNDGNDDEV